MLNTLNAVVCTVKVLIQPKQQ